MKIKEKQKERDEKEKINMTLQMELSNLREINDQHVRETNEQNSKKLVIMDKISKLKVEKLEIETQSEHYKNEKTKVQGKKPSKKRKIECLTHF
jgi:hypothetical protein